MKTNRQKIFLLFCIAACHAALAFSQPGQRGPRPRRMAFVTDTVMVHDPVMAFEDGTYYLLSTGHGLQWATSKDRKTWVVQSTPFIEKIPQWTFDSVPGFQGHVWAPDIIRWHDRWLLAYSCSTFGRNTSAIGLMSADRLNGQWKDEGCLVASREGRDNWNAIDPAFIVDDNDQLWLTWGSFWDGIQMGVLDNLTISPLDYSNEESSNRSIVKMSKQKTIARRYNLNSEASKAALPINPNPPKNPTSDYAGPNAIEAPFILKHGGWYYLFVSWDYCCQGAKSNYSVAVGRSRQVDGPYVDRKGIPMTEGGGELFLEGDKKEYDATGHCAAYDLPSGETVFICHGYSTKMNGASMLIQRPVTWTPDAWPTLP